MKRKINSDRSAPQPLAGSRPFLVALLVVNLLAAALFSSTGCCGMPLSLAIGLALYAVSMASVCWVTRAVAKSQQRLAEQRYRRLPDLEVDGIMTGAHDGVVIGANSRTRELFGRRREKRIGKPVLDEQGRAPAGQASFFDIAERTRVEKALRESEDRYRLLFEMESDAIFLISTCDGRILDVNQAATAMYGYTREELLAMTNEDVSAEPEETRRATRSEDVEMAQRLNVPLRKHRKKDGSVFWVGITGRRFELDGRDVQIAAIRDVTDLRRSQELLESWNATLERRVAERTVEVEKYMRQLQALTGRLLRVEEDERQRITDVLHEDLQQILVATRMTLGVAIGSTKSQEVKQTLASADKMLEQSIRLTRSIVQDIAVPAVREGELPFALDWLKQQMDEKFGLTVELTMDAHLPVVSEKVYYCVYRAVQELLFNVVKHAQVTRAAVAIRNLEAENKIRVVVRDQGCGFAHDGGDQAEKEKAGNGFGLFGIRERVEGLNGQLSVWSRKGAGTTIALTLPVCDWPHD